MTNPYRLRMHFSTLAEPFIYCNIATLDDASTQQNYRSAISQPVMTKGWHDGEVVWWETSAT